MSVCCCRTRGDDADFGLPRAHRRCERAFRVTRRDRPRRCSVLYERLRCRSSDGSAAVPNVQNAMLGNDIGCRGRSRSPITCARERSTQALGQHTKKNQSRSDPIRFGADGRCCRCPSGMSELPHCAFHEPPHSSAIPILSVERLSRCRTSGSYWLPRYPSHHAVSSVLDGNRRHQRSLRNTGSELLPASMGRLVGISRGVGKGRRRHGGRKARPASIVRSNRLLGGKKSPHDAASTSRLLWRARYRSCLETRSRRAGLLRLSSGCRPGCAVAELP